MKIIDLKPEYVTLPSQRRPGLDFVKLTTDNGISGFGEVYQIPFIRLPLRQ